MATPPPDASQSQSQVKIEDDRTGMMVPLVPDEGVDDGPGLATCEVPIEPGDTLDTLAERMHTEEHRLLVEAVTRLLADRQR